MTDSGAQGARVSPYQGLTPFDERDAEYFFGREREARLICADLFAAPVSLLYGASGVGKSSLLRAGVLPLLRPRGDLLALVFSEWQSNPLEGLKRCVLRALPGCGVSPDRRLAAFLRECAAKSARRLMIVLDQFEEYSLYHPANDEPFAEQFPEATALPDLSVSFLLSLREEAVARLDRFEGRISMLFDNLRRIDHLTEGAARSAIEMPLQKYTDGTVSAEPELVSAVVEQVRTGRVHIGDTGRGTTGDSGGRIEASYLQLVMTRIWNEERAEDSPLLRLTTLSRLGGAPKIVQTHLNAVMEKLSDEERNIAARVFQQLVTPSGTKIAHSVHDLAGYAGVDAGKLRVVLDALSRGTDRILRPVAELPDRPGDPRYEIFHDRLAPAILDWRLRQVKVQETFEADERKEVELSVQSEVLRSMIGIVLGSFSPGERSAAEQILSRFVTPSGVRTIVSADEFSTGEGKKVIDAFLQNSIVHEEERGGRAFLELTHDVLVEPVLRWLAGYQGVRSRQRRRLAPAPRLADTRVIAELLQSGRIVVILGSGASASERPPVGSWTPSSPYLPAGTELQRLLASRAGFPSDELDQASFSEVASYFASAAGRRKLEALLDQVFVRAYPPARIHRLLAKVARSVPLTILTTTFDLLMENELARVGLRFSMAYSTLDRKRPLAWRGERITVHEFQPSWEETLVYKVFGSPPSYVVTEEDDMELFSQIAEGRLPPPFIRESLARRHVLFLGMGLSTWPQRLLLRQLRGPEVTSGDSSRGWAIVRGLGAADQYRWRTARVEPFEEDINDFAERLAKHLGISLDDSGT